MAIVKTIQEHTAQNGFFWASNEEPIPSSIYAKPRPHPHITENQHETIGLVEDLMRHRNETPAEGAPNGRKER